METIQFKLNGKPMNLNVDSNRPLLWVLRSDLQLTGTKYGCGEGLCGSCTVVVDGRAERSCQMTMKDVENKDLLTIEGLAQNGNLHPLQQAFMDHDALQCGFCTSGMIMNAYGLLRQNANPDLSEIIQDMDDNLCRCGAHKRIVQAIESVSQGTKGGAK